MIISEAIRSLKSDIVRAFFFWLTFVLTTMFIFLFYAISTTADEEQTIVTGVTVLVILVCSMDIFSANNFFVHAKAKDMAVRLVCGATYSFMASYLLIQTVFLLLLAIPLGIAGAYGLLPVINQYLSTSAAISSQAIMNAGIMVGYILFWIILLNLSFSYRSAASMMLNGQGALINGSGSVLSTGKSGEVFKNILYMVMYIGPLLIILFANVPFYVGAVLGFIGLFGMIQGFWIPLLSRRIEKKKIENPNAIISIGFIRDDLRNLRMNIGLFSGCALLLFALLCSTQVGDMEHVLILISYVMMNLLLALAIMFKYATVQSNRVRYFKTLLNIGYLEADLKKIIGNEICGLYTMILAWGGIYIIVMLAAQMMSGSVAMVDVVIGIAGYCIPILACMLISYFYYQRTIFSK